MAFCFLLLGNLLCIMALAAGKTAKTPVSVSEMKLDEVLPVEKSSSYMGISKVAASGQRVVDYQVLVKDGSIRLDEAEREALCRIVEAEAGIEDEDGKLLVANVVLNRVANEQFPGTVTEVVFQERQGVYQFSPVGDGRYYQVEISQDTYRAVERALSGDDISQGALYFVARQCVDDGAIGWFDNQLSYLFTHGGHDFYTYP